MFFSELTGADQESNRKEARRNVARSSFGMGSDTFGLRFGTT